MFPRKKTLKGDNRAGFKCDYSAFCTLPESNNVSVVCQKQPEIKLHKIYSMALHKNSL